MPEEEHRHSKGAGMEQYQFPCELPLISQLGWWKGAEGKQVFCGSETS